MSSGRQDWVRLFVEQPILAVSDLTPDDLPTEHGVYGWYCGGELFYVGEAPKRTLRQRILQHLRKTARQSTLRNKVAKTIGCEPAGDRRYSEACERRIREILEKCDLRVLQTLQGDTAQAQLALIEQLDPPMNDHAGQNPRWDIVVVQRVLVPCLQ